MCGIAGIIAPDLPAVDLESAVLKMRGSLHHRGPDDEGFFATDGVALSHTRLSIIDIDGGHQPLSNEDGTIHLVINGEIYNYKSLRQELLSRGHHLRTQSDCEAILHLYEDEGESCLEKLEGMYAFALWDNRNGKLLLARDRFGIKPLYVAVSEGMVCFASELTAIIQSGLIKTEIDPQALYAYMAFSYVPGPFSILKDIQKVKPAEMIIVQKDSVQSNIYWTPRYVNVPRKKSHAAKELNERIEESVRSHLVSDVPVAAFLSGGVDSSGIVAMAQKHLELETFCVSFPHTGVDEAPIARRVADHLGSRHREVNIEIDPEALINEVINFMDEPFGDSSALPTFALCREARKVAKVVLSGDGGDEVFGGYTGRYRVAALKACLPAPGSFAYGLRQLPPWRSGRRHSLPEMLDMATLAEEERYIFERQITSTSERATLFSHKQALEFEQNLKVFAKQLLAKAGYKHPVHRALWIDLLTSLTDDMLVKVDRMSMAHGLEVRVPFLDHRLVEFALSLPPAWLVSPLPVEGKRLLRRVIAPYLPDNILNRPKQGFVVPLNKWLKNHFISMFDALCLKQDSCLTGLLDQKALRKLLEKSIGNTPRQDLYALLILELWLRRLRIIKNF
jgi:asparagine synthase (glutamine-hydrolysing)